MKIFKLFIILYFTSWSIAADIPEKLADFNLNSIRESEKIGLSFHNAVATTGALSRGIFVAGNGFIRIPVYPSFRTDDMMPELNLDAEQGTLEFRFSPIDPWTISTPGKILFAYKSIGGNQAGMTLRYESGRLTFEVIDKNGTSLKTESNVIGLHAEKFYSIAVSWQINPRMKDSILKVYLNNQKIAESKGRLSELGMAPADFYIGSDNGKKAASGTYDEIKIWSVNRDKFDIKEDTLEEKLKNTHPIKVENFVSFPQSACRNDKLLGKSLVLPADCLVDEMLGVNQGMVEFWIKPLELDKPKITVCQLGNIATLEIIDGTICLKWREQILRTESKFKLKEWNAVSLMWNLRDKCILLYLNGKKAGSLKMKQGIPSTSRLRFSFKNGKALLTGVTIWHVFLPQKNIYNRGFRLTGNYSSDFQALLQYDVPALVPGDYWYSNVPDGIIDNLNNKGPYSFSKGKLSDGKIGVGASDRVSFYKSREIIFDLKETYSINECVVYCVCRPNWYTEKIEFYTSTDGKEWVLAGKVTNNAPKYKTHRLVPFQKKIGKKARFLKIKATPKPGYLVSISDVLIFGLPDNE
jgi:hypothetical protein